MSDIADVVEPFDVAADRAAFAQLPARARFLASARVAGYTLEEAAHLLGCSRRTAYRELERARVALRGVPLVERRCEGCGGLLAASVTRRARFCGASCRARYWRTERRHVSEGRGDTSSEVTTAAGGA